MNITKIKSLTYYVNKKEIFYHIYIMNELHNLNTFFAVMLKLHCKNVWVCMYVYVYVCMYVIWVHH